MSVALSAIRLFIFLALALLCSSLPAHAGPFLATLDDFHPNCDIRQLNLSADQHAALRRLRTDFKQINDKAYRKTVRSDRNRRQTIIKIFSGDSFDSNAARDYVENRYLSSMDYAVDEMEINTASIICSIHANASNGCLHACANKSIKNRKAV